MSKAVEEGNIPCSNLSFKHLSVTLVDAGLDSGVSQIQRKKWGRSFADFLFQNASADFVWTTVKRLQDLKERSEKASEKAPPPRTGALAMGGIGFTDSIPLR